MQFSGQLISPDYAVTLQRDKLGRIVHQDEAIQGVSQIRDYAYDASGRLLEVKKNGVVAQRYGYDSNGNRTQLNGQAIASYDAQDRLLSYGAASYTYTANGELATKTENGARTTYHYDVLGNLMQVTLPAGKRIDYGVNRDTDNLIT